MTLSMDSPSITVAERTRLRCKHHTWSLRPQCARRRSRLSGWLFRRAEVPGMTGLYTGCVLCIACCPLSRYHTLADEICRNRTIPSSIHHTPIHTRAWQVERRGKTCIAEDFPICGTKPHFHKAQDHQTTALRHTSLPPMWMTSSGTKTVKARTKFNGFKLKADKGRCLCGAAGLEDVTQSDLPSQLSLMSRGGERRPCLRPSWENF